MFGSIVCACSSSGLMPGPASGPSWPSPTAYAIVIGGSAPPAVRERGVEVGAGAPGPARVDDRVGHRAPAGERPVLLGTGEQLVTAPPRAGE